MGSTLLASSLCLSSQVSDGMDLRQITSLAGAAAEAGTQTVDAHSSEEVDHLPGFILGI